MKHTFLYTGLQRRMDKNMNVFMPSDTILQLLMWYTKDKNVLWN